MVTVEVGRELKGDVMVLHLKGDALDAGNVARFRTETADLFNEHKNFVFDLSGLKFVDSSGIGAFLSCLRRANSSGGNVKLAALQPGVRSLFELVRMDRLFEIFDTPDEAIASFGA